MQSSEWPERLKLHRMRAVWVWKPFRTVSSLAEWQPHARGGYTVGVGAEVSAAQSPPDGRIG